jgi:hypothetical protein
MEETEFPNNEIAEDGKAYNICAYLLESVQSGFGLTNLKKNLMTSWAGSGATSTELMVLDSMTNTPILAAMDDKKTGLKEKFTKWGSAEDAFKYWANRIRLFLDQARDEPTKPICSNSRRP